MLDYYSDTNYYIAIFNFFFAGAATREKCRI